MSRMIVIGVLFVVLAATVFVVRSHHLNHASNANVQVSTGAEQESIQNKHAKGTPSLEETAQKFLDAILAGSPTDLLKYWSDEGVTFGVDADPVSKAQFLQQVERKSDLFCFFFDSNCLRNQVAEARRRAKKGGDASGLYSYKDLITNARHMTSKVTRRDEAGNLLGDLKIRIENGDALKGNEQN